MNAASTAGTGPDDGAAPGGAWVSVVVPVFNKAPTVARAITSVLAQTDPRFELIVVCDPSTDGSEQVVAGFADARLRVLYRAQPGPGGYAARNLGARQARTPWVAFLDADDEWRPEHLACMAALARQHPGAAMLSAGWAVEGDGRAEDAYHRQRHALGNHALDVIGYLRWEARSARPVCTDVACLRRALLLQAGGFPEGELQRSGDLDTWVRCVVAAGGLAWSSHIGAVYHREAGHMVTCTAPVSLGPHEATTAALLRQAHDPVLMRLLLMRLNHLAINAWVSNIQLPRPRGFRMAPHLHCKPLVLHAPGHVLKCAGYATLSLLPARAGGYIHRRLAQLRDLLRRPIATDGTARPTPH